MSINEADQESESGSLGWGLRRRSTRQSDNQTQAEMSLVGEVIQTGATLARVVGYIAREGVLALRESRERKRKLFEAGMRLTGSLDFGRDKRPLDRLTGNTYPLTFDTDEMGEVAEYTGVLTHSITAERWGQVSSDEPANWVLVDTFHSSGDESDKAITVIRLGGSLPTIEVSGADAPPAYGPSVFHHIVDTLHARASTRFPAE